jgi:lysophospholipase L1-like esterase
MYKSKTKERRIFTNRRRVRRRYTGFWAIASVALFLLILELFTRIFIDISGDRSKFAQTQTEPDITQAYSLNFIAQDSQTQPTAEDKNLLRAKPSVSVGYQLVSNQETKHWQINEQGFRDAETIPLVKPKNEMRIFLLGGSTAFGYGASSNKETISEYLEQRLQQRVQQQQASPELYQSDIIPQSVAKQPDQTNILPKNSEAATQPTPTVAKPAQIKPGEYRVINAAVPGYASGNELAQLALEVLKYKPDLIVILNGYQDLMLPSDEEAAQVPQRKNFLDNPATEIVASLNQLLEPVENRSYLAKIAQNSWLEQVKNSQQADFLLNEETSKLVKHLPSSPEELQKRVDRYVAHQRQILNLSAAGLVPVVVAAQPEITGRNPSQLTDAEGAIATDLGRTYIQQMKKDYPVLIEATQQLAKSFPYNLKVVDLYQLSDQYPSPSFIDPIHLSESANQKVAEQLYYAITSLPKMQVTPTKAPTPAPTSKPM